MRAATGTGLPWHICQGHDPDRPSGQGQVRLRTRCRPDERSSAFRLRLRQTGTCRAPAYSRQDLRVDRTGVRRCSSVMCHGNMVRPRPSTIVGSGGAAKVSSRGGWMGWLPSPPFAAPKSPCSCDAHYRGKEQAGPTRNGICDPMPCQRNPASVFPTSTTTPLGSADHLIMLEMQVIETQRQPSHLQSRKRRSRRAVIVPS